MDFHLKDIKHFIDGRYVNPVSLRIASSSLPSLAPSNLPVINPCTEEVLCHIPLGDESLVSLAVDSAKRAKPSWSELSGCIRATYLEAIAVAIERKKEEFARVEALNTGKPYAECEWDMDDVASCFRYFATLARELDSRQMEEVKDIPNEDPNNPEYKAFLRYESVGVVGAIVPWNYPLLMATWKIAPAIAAGCTMVLKPSEVTPLTTLMMGEIFNEVNLPSGVVNIILGDGKLTGSVLTNHPKVDKLSFTGSVPTGSLIMSNAAKLIKNVTLELGGKSCSIVFDSVDLRSVVEWCMFGVFWTNGQICSATSRLIVQDNIYDKFKQLLIEQTERIQIGHVMEEKVKLGPLINKSQYEKVRNYIKEATAKGATLLTGGLERPKLISPSMPSNNIPNNKGYFVKPTILEVNSDMQVWKEEIFGPVLCIQKFSSEEEAIAMANDCDFGLANAVFTDNENQLNRVTARLESGIVWNNCSQPCFCQLPWGGQKKSGIGRDLGREGFQSYLETKQIVKKVEPKVPLGWYDINEEAFLRSKL